MVGVRIVPPILVVMMLGGSAPQPSQGRSEQKMTYKLWPP